MALAIKYYFEFYDLLGTRHKVEILKEGFTGSLTDISEKTGSNPVVLSSLGVESKFTNIIGIECTLNLLIETPFEYAEFLTATNKDYQIKVYHFVVSWVIDWIGWVVPDTYLEPHTTPPYEFMIRATCGLGLLQSYKYESATDIPYTGQDDLLSVIVDCLAEINNGLPIASAINFFATGQTETAAYDPLPQTYINRESFRLEYNEGDTCYNVLEKILKVFAARIILTGGAWLIVSIDDVITDQTYRIYTAAGVYTNNSTLTSNKQAITLPTASPVVAFVDNIQQVETIPAWKQFKVLQEYEYRENILEDSFFVDSIWDTINTLLYWTKSATGTWLSQNNDGAFMNTNATTIGVARYIQQTPITKHLVTAGNYTLRFKFITKSITGGTVHAQIKLSTAGAPYYLTTGNTWSTTISYKTILSGTALTTYEFESAVIPVNDCDITITLYEKVSSSSTAVWWKSVECELMTATAYKTKTIQVDTIIDADNTKIPDDLELSLGTLPTTPNSPEVIYWNGLLDSSGDALTNWHHKGDTDHDTMLNHLIDVIGDNQDVPTFKLRGKILGGYILGHESVLKDTINSILRNFICGNLNYNIKQGIWDGEWFQIK